MKQDIRELFRDNDDLSKKLSENHHQEFVRKLKKTIHQKKSIVPFLKVAASLLVIFSVGYYALNQKKTLPLEQTALELQVQQIEKEYLQQIDDEWKKFIKVTKDQKLINRYKEKFKKLGSNYEELLKNFKENPNNISALENLINNLQTRLQLLKNIQNHIKVLNTKNKTDETIIL